MAALRPRDNSLGHAVTSGWLQCCRSNRLWFFRHSERDDILRCSGQPLCVVGRGAGARVAPRYPALPCTALHGPARPCTALHGAAPHHATTPTAPRRAASLSLCVAPRLCGERAACSPACSTAGLGVHSQGISRGERCVDAAQALPEGLEAPEIRDAIKVRAWCMHGRGVHELCA